MYKNSSRRYRLVLTHDTSTVIAVDSYILFDHEYCFMGGGEVSRSAQYFRSRVNEDVHAINERVDRRVISTSIVSVGPTETITV